MNIQRYKMPVIIAAAIHGALFLIGSEESIVIKVPATASVPFRPPDVDPVTMEPDIDPDVSPDTGGPVSDCRVAPTLPDLPQELRNNDTFTVPVAVYRPAEKAVTTLEGVTGLPSTPGNGGDGWIGRVPADIGRLDRIPRAVVQGSPRYPDGFQRDGIDGSVTVEFVVDTTGRVVKADATRWSHREFVEPAVRAVLGWCFEPGTMGGRKVSFRMAVPIEFNAAR